MNSIHFDPQALIARVDADQHGFFRPADIAALSAHPVARLWPVLVRCGGGRFTCPAQNVEHFVAIIEREQSDHVRDCSMVADYTYDLSPTERR